MKPGWGWHQKHSDPRRGNSPQAPRPRAEKTRSQGSIRTWSQDTDREGVDLGPARDTDSQSDPSSRYRTNSPTRAWCPLRPPFQTVGLQRASACGLLRASSTRPKPSAGAQEGKTLTLPWSPPPPTSLCPSRAPSPSKQPGASP